MDDGYPRFEEIPTTRLQRWWFRNWTLKYGRLRGVNDIPDDEILDWPEDFQ